MINVVASKGHNDILSSLLHDSDSYDFYLVGNDTKDQVGAHKLILATVSPYFKAMFASNLRESTAKSVTFEIFTRDMLIEFVQFVYLGKLSVESDQLVPLFAAADHFQFQSLSDACRTVLGGSLTPQNACQWYMDSLQWGQLTEDLKTRCLQFMTKNVQAVSTAKAFVDLPFEIIQSFVRDDCNAISEIDLFKAVTNWIDKNPSTDSESQESLLDFIRYPNIAPEDLVKTVGEWKMKCTSKYMAALEFHLCPRIDRMSANQCVPRSKSCVLVPLVCPYTWHPSPSDSTTRSTHRCIKVVMPPASSKHCPLQGPLVALIASKNCVFNIEIRDTQGTGLNGQLCMSFFQLQEDKCSDELRKVELQVVLSRHSRSLYVPPEVSKHYKCTLIAESPSFCTLSVEGTEGGKHDIKCSLPLVISIGVMNMKISATVSIN